MHLDPSAAARAVREYNAGTYRGCKNVDVDQAAYDRFRNGLPENEDDLIDAIRFVGEDYGGAQLRFLPHGYREEAALIVGQLLPARARWVKAIKSSAPLRDAAPPEYSLAFVLAPFVGTKRWPVWGTKTMHFIRPDVYPILDSRAKKALGMASLGSTPRDYHRFCMEIRRTLLENDAALASAREADGGLAPSDLKLLDKILYEIGG